MLELQSQIWLFKLTYAKMSKFILSFFLIFLLNILDSDPEVVCARLHLLKSYKFVFLKQKYLSVERLSLFLFEDMTLLISIFPSKKKKKNLQYHW